MMMLYLPLLLLELQEKAVRKMAAEKYIGWTQLM
jgi:hypothetical protein